ncbi:carbonic anhydrase [Streptomyces sp. NPDC051921]|uniref:carbonic anhydrase n=1 Tax=Streptomyces sp. NPDC051921 TaxID=3155806 RepID=UPI00343208E6
MPCPIPTHSGARSTSRHPGLALAAASGAAGLLSACGGGHQRRPQVPRLVEGVGRPSRRAGVLAYSHPDSPAEALARLRAGNARWVESRPSHPDRSRPRRGEQATGQHPFASVFSCIDSRVPTDLVLDEGLGYLLGIRTAAHTLDRLVPGSLQYGPLESDTPLVVVMGHQRCGAVTAAVEWHENPVTEVPGGIADIVKALAPRLPEDRRARNKAVGVAGARQGRAARSRPPRHPGRLLQPRHGHGLVRRPTTRRRSGRHRERRRWRPRDGRVPQRRQEARSRRHDADRVTRRPPHPGPAGSQSPPHPTSNGSALPASYPYRCRPGRVHPTPPKDLQEQGREQGTERGPPDNARRPSLPVRA